jgi:CubicO group peptidase (beta-lactamase class C family)
VTSNITLTTGGLQSPEHHRRAEALQERIARITTRHPTVGLALGVVRGDSFDTFFGHGVSDIDAATPMTEHTVVRIASITKTFTAVAIMQLAERDLVDLDAPAASYLRSYRLLPSRYGDRAPTIRHLLTHTSGIGEVVRAADALRPDFGESVPAGDPIPSLADFYRGAIQLRAEPGSRFVYNNHGPATLGQIVQDVTGLPLAEYLRANVFEPLGMHETDLGRTERIRSALATGYEITDRGVVPQADREMVTHGAASIYSTAADMARYLIALLDDDTAARPSILQRATLATMFAPHYQPDPRLVGMGLGFFRYRVGDRVIVGHQGTHPGFHSQIHLDPIERVAVMAFTNGAHMADLWLPAETAALLDDIEGATRDGAALPNPEIWSHIRGWYALDAAPTDVRLRGMIGAGVEVFMRRASLMLRFLTPVPALAAGFPMYAADPSDPFVFEIRPDDASGPMRVAFRPNAAGRMDLTFEAMPIVLKGQPAWTNPRRAITGVAAAGVGVCAARRLQGR